MSKKDQYRAYVEQWRQAGPELERIHAEELRRYDYKPADADALLDIGARSPRKDESASGLIEMQRWFMLAARRQGLLPTAVHEEKARYGADRQHGESQKNRTPRE